MASNFNYKKTTTVNMKLVGILDTDTGMIEVDGVDKNLVKTLSDFNGVEVTITVKTSVDEELDEPIDTDEDSIDIDED